MLASVSSRHANKRTLLSNTDYAQQTADVHIKASAATSNTTAHLSSVLVSHLTSLPLLSTGDLLYSAETLRELHKGRYKVSSHREMFVSRSKCLFQTWNLEVKFKSQACSAFTPQSITPYIHSGVVNIHLHTTCWLMHRFFQHLVRRLETQSLHLAGRPLPLPHV